MSKSYFSGEDGHPFDSDDDGNLFGDNGREEEYDSGAELSTSPRPCDEKYYGVNDEWGNQSDPFQRASEDVLGERRMVRASLSLSPAFARTSASAAASASTTLRTVVVATLMGMSFNPPSPLTCSC